MSCYKTYVRTQKILNLDDLRLAIIVVFIPSMIHMFFLLPFLCTFIRLYLINLISYQCHHSALSIIIERKYWVKLKLFIDCL